MSEKYVEVVVIPAEEEPYTLRVKNTLEAFQELVGGHIETVTFASDSCIVVNEEGIINDLPLNENIRSCIPSGMDIYGDVVFVGVDGDEFCSLDDSVADWVLDKALIAYRSNNDDFWEF